MDGWPRGHFCTGGRCASARSAPRPQALGGPARRPRFPDGISPSLSATSKPAVHEFAFEASSCLGKSSTHQPAKQASAPRQKQHWDGDLSRITGSMPQYRPRELTRDNRPRILNGALWRQLQAAGAVVIEGPKACGKTMTAQRQAASSALLDIDGGARQALAVDPALVLAGARPHLLDDWQVAPKKRMSLDSADVVKSGAAGGGCVRPAGAVPAPRVGPVRRRRRASHWCRMLRLPAPAADDPVRIRALHGRGVATCAVWLGWLPARRIRVSPWGISERRWRSAAGQPCKSGL